MRNPDQRVAKLQEQCDIVAALIIAIRPAYAKASLTQRALLETIVGASIWYIPKPPQAWTGQLSLGALKAFHPDSGILSPKLSEEHVYPRKVTARLLLETPTLDGTTLAKLFSEQFGRMHLITPEENKRVQQFQRAKVFTSPENAYAKAGIVFINLNNEELRGVKRRNPEVINAILARGV